MSPVSVARDETKARPPDGQNVQNQSLVGHPRRDEYGKPLSRGGVESFVYGPKKSQIGNAKSLAS